MQNILRKLYKEYGQYSNYRNFPLDLDGLKPVERRVLLSAFKIAKDKFAISRQVDSYTTGNFHPHGECYGSIVQLVKQGFLDGQGNFGSSIGVESVGAAAPRYTECRINKKSLDLAFKYIKYVPWVDTEMRTTEPLFLPTMYPICLLGNDYTMGIGFGYKTFIPCYDIKDLYKRLSWLLGERKTKPTIAPITDCNITSTPADLEKLLTKGKAKIQVEGVVIENKRANTVTLKSWPPGKRFESLLNKFSKWMDGGTIGYTDLSSEATGTEIVFKVLRERSRDKIYTEFVNALKEAIKGVISFETTVVDTELKVMIKPIDNMLLDTYKMFTSINEVMLQKEIEKIDEMISEYNTLEMIRKPLSYCIGEEYDIPATITEITNATVVQAEVIKELISKYRIQKLLTLDTDTTELNNKKKELQDKLTNLPKFVLEQYNEL